MLFPKAPDSCDEENLKYISLHCSFTYMSSKRVYWIFKILFQIGNINAFVLHCVLFSTYVQVNGDWICISLQRMFIFIFIGFRKSMYYKIC